MTSSAGGSSGMAYDWTDSFGQSEYMTQACLWQITGGMQDQE